MRHAYKSDAVAPPLSEGNDAGFPTDGDPANGIPTTVFGTYWAHATSSEIVEVIEHNGLTRTATTWASLRGHRHADHDAVRHGGAARRRDLREPQRAHPGEPARRGGESRATPRFAIRTYDGLRPTSPRERAHASQSDPATNSPTRYRDQRICRPRMRHGRGAVSDEPPAAARLRPASRRTIRRRARAWAHSISSGDRQHHRGRRPDAGRLGPDAASPGRRGEDRGGRSRHSAGARRSRPWPSTFRTTRRAMRAICAACWRRPGELASTVPEHTCNNPSAGDRRDPGRLARDAGQRCSAARTAAGRIHDRRGCTPTIGSGTTPKGLCDHRCRRGGAAAAAAAAAAIRLHSGGGYGGRRRGGAGTTRRHGRNTWRLRHWSCGYGLSAEAGRYDGGDPRRRRGNNSAAGGDGGLDPLRGQDGGDGAADRFAGHAIKARRRRRRWRNRSQGVAVGIAT